MLELPEIYVLAKQIRSELVNLRIIRAQRGNTPSKWVFYRVEKEEYENVLSNDMIESVFSKGRFLYLKLMSGYTLLIGEIGGKIQLFNYKDKLPDKRHLTIWFEKNKILNVTVSGWGFLELDTPEELENHKHAGKGKSPLEPDFTYQFFSNQLDNWNGPPAKTVKAFLISNPQICGIGNSYAQDILFNSQLHPKSIASTLTEEERERFYKHTMEVINNATQMGGRADETDLYGNKGGYPRLMSAKTSGEPCPNCHAPIETFKYLGGSCYICPKCQPDPSIAQVT